IDDLDSSSFPKRETATRRLKELGENVEGHLRRALENNPSAEKRRRLVTLLGEIDPFRPSNEALTAVRVIAALEKAGTPEARAALKEVAAVSTTARVKREVDASLQRLR